MKVTHIDSTVGLLGPHSALVKNHPPSGWESAKNIISSVVRAVPEEKPLMSGNGISVSISLAEPVLFLHGFKHSDTSERSTAMLRGSLNLRVTKPIKIKAVTLKFQGKPMTKWPEGIPPKNVKFKETDTLMNHTWPFFNAQFPTAEAGTGASQINLFKTHTSNVLTQKGLSGSSNSPSTNLGLKEAKCLSFKVNQSWSFQKGGSWSLNKGESSPNRLSVAQKGYQIFNPGDYMYNFELPLDSHLPETINVELGSVKYELEAIIERAGAFCLSLIGTKEVTLIRAPSEGSLAHVEPIAISRNWGDQLQYDIVMSGKSFPLGTQIPITFKLTPLAKVQCKSIKVFVTENVEYFCSNKRVRRMEPARKIQLFEKQAGSEPTSAFPGSSIRIVSGGGVPCNQRAAALRGELVEVSDPTNLLGDLDSDAEIGTTEMEFNVQLPSCYNNKHARLHFDTTYQNIKVHHWIKILMRISKPDQDNPTRRRHFEISIDWPFHILSCQATQANTTLPAYSLLEPANDSWVPECSCPGSPVRRAPLTISVPNLSNIGRSCENLDEDLATASLPPAPIAHINRPQNSRLQRLIHLLRPPLLNPPAFEHKPPPLLEILPPLYESIVPRTNALNH
ncbi:hypothetical protein B0J11DRAFT_239777 [Dendryphion nanum]|uniref:Arrestin C-terminal-like domain-containing protein n=1 Tax=Dendryphion nanum TaxID=256645 RepID=A0A9P9CXK0_9PLEO|nr:hypothetical protein B0J11DRAFT_239777 [Dendryphion nanum]